MRLFGLILAIVVLPARGGPEELFAKTCAAWLDNFDDVADQVTAMYDETFTRMWRLYLAGSSAAFETGTMQLYQVVFAPQDNNAGPMTRTHQYPGRH